MGYFPNGTAGEDYYERWCARCLHENPDKEITCAIWMVHLLRNYDECNNDESILHALIPRTKNGLGNERCTMFVDRGLLSNLQIERFEHEAAP